MDDLLMETTFAFPHQHSTFETLLIHQAPMGIGLERVMTSPGYNVSSIPCHQIGVHWGGPVPITHRRYDAMKTHVFQRGDVLITPAGTPVEYAHSAPVDALYIYLEPVWVNSVAERMGLYPSAIELSDNLGTTDWHLAYLAEALVREMEVALPGSQLLVETLATQLCVHLLREYRQPRGVVRPVQELRHALDFIHTHLAESLSISQIAATEHLTPFHFSRRFKQLYAISPHQYILQQRVNRAHELLKNSDMPIADIALRVGFANHSHLTHQFKRLTGQTPLEVRQQARPQD